MATAAWDLRYQNRGPVDGSLAHDLDWAVRERELNHAGEAPRRREIELEGPKVRTQSESKVRLRERQHVSVFSVLGITAVLGMAVLVLMSYIQLTMLSADTVALKSQLAHWKSQVKLTKGFKVDSKDVEKLAKKLIRTYQADTLSAIVVVARMVKRQPGTPALTRAITSFSADFCWS